MIETSRLRKCCSIRGESSVKLVTSSNPSINYQPFEAFGGGVLMRISMVVTATAEPESEGSLPTISLQRANSTSQSVTN